MKSAKQNISQLPEYAYGVLLMDKSLIRIKAGEMGYYPVGEGEKAFLADAYKGKTTDEVADLLNAEKGITKAQRKAMEWGSQFGWESGLADIENYDENGNPYSEKNPRPVKA